jgi:hypothetical protein
MTAPSCSEDDFIELFKKMGGAELAKFLGINIRAVYIRRARIEQIRGIKILSPLHNRASNNHRTIASYTTRVPLDIQDGIVFIGSDLHLVPGQTSTAFRGFLKLAEDLRPTTIILNGDILDFPRISKHAPIGYKNKPCINEELEWADKQLGLLRSSSRGHSFFWVAGNHDLRYENYLSARAPEMGGIPGFTLKEHFPHWQHCFSLWINDNVVVKHRFKGGIHATHSNVLWAGKSIVTGHLHSLKVTPFDDYNPRTRWGVDTGTLNVVQGEHTDYDEDNPANQRQGFSVLTFCGGKLLQPEIARVEDETHIDFRGKLIKI